MTVHNLVEKSYRQKSMLITWAMLKEIEAVASYFGAHVMNEAIAKNVDVRLTKRKEGILVEWMDF